MTFINGMTASMEHTLSQEVAAQYAFTSVNQLVVINKLTGQEFPVNGKVIAAMRNGKLFW